MITKKQTKLINKVYKEISYLAYTQSFEYALDEILKVNKQEEKAHRGYSDWEDYHDTNATVNLMSKLMLCEKIIEGALTNVDIYEPYFSALEMETSSGMLRAKALGIRYADLIKDTLKAEQIGEFRKLDYAKLVSKELQPI
jgi:hypothetical protein